MLDRVQQPEKYDWLAEEEAARETARLKKGKRPKKKRLNSTAESYRYTKEEIERLVSSPFSMLTRKEVLVRKLLSKFHDNPGLAARARMEQATGFDPNLSGEVRAKHRSTLTSEERQWASIDRILNPAIWAACQHEPNKNAALATVHNTIATFEPQEALTANTQWECTSTR
jgi:hypothetical protein